MRTRQLPLYVGLIMLSLMLVSVVSASYPMFHYDAQRTGYVTQDGPQTNAVNVGLLFPNRVGISFPTPLKVIVNHLLNIWKPRIC